MGELCSYQGWDAEKEKESKAALRKCSRGLGQDEENDRGAGVEELS